MKKFLDNFSYYNFLIFDYVVAYLVNLISKLFKKSSNKNYILVYAPYRYKPWILNKIINDLKNSSQIKESYKIFKSLSSLAIFRFFKGGCIFLMHQSSIKKCEISGFNLNQLSTFYTHSQINQKGIKNINNLKKIFCLNNYEYALLSTNGIDSSKLVDFPVGIHSNFFETNNKYKNIEDREFDVLFSLRYFVKNAHYKIRKRYSFIINLANLLAESDLKVCILGEDWEEVREALNENIEIQNLEYIKSPKIYQNSKVYCNPSLAEGGPSSLIEAFASGCMILSSPIGLSFNLCLDDKFSCLIPFDKDEYYWKKNIFKFLSNNNIDSKMILNTRNEKIQKSLFKNLSKKLEENLFKI